MGLLAQIGLLFWKDLVIIKRSKIWIICELLFSLLLLPIIIALLIYVRFLKVFQRKIAILRHRKNGRMMLILSNHFSFPAIRQILAVNKSIVPRQLTDIIIAIMMLF